MGVVRTTGVGGGPVRGFEAWWAPVLHGAGATGSVGWRWVAVPGGLGLRAYKYEIQTFSTFDDIFISSFPEQESGPVHETFNCPSVRNEICLCVPCAYQTQPIHFQTSSACTHMCRTPMPSWHTLFPSPLTLPCLCAVLQRSVSVCFKHAHTHWPHIHVEFPTCRA